MVQRKYGLTFAAVLAAVSILTLPNATPAQAAPAAVECATAAALLIDLRAYPRVDEAAGHPTVLANVDCVREWATAVVPATDEYDEVLVLFRYDNGAQRWKPLNLGTGGVCDDWVPVDVAVELNGCAPNDDSGDDLPDEEPGHGKQPFGELTGVGDLTGDGRPDMVAVQSGTSSGALWFYPGTAAGRLGARKQISSNWESLRELTGIGFADADDLPDVLAVDKGTGRLWLYPGAAGGRLGHRRMVGTGGWNGMSGLSSLGYTSDGDRYPDFAAVELSTGKLWLYPGTATGFGTRTQIGSGGWNGMTELAGIGDLNRDGWGDLVAVEKSSGKLWLYPGTGTGRVGTRVQIGTNWNSMRSLDGVSDLTGDGMVDLIAVEKSTGKAWLYPGTAGHTLGARKLLGGGWNG